MVLVEEEICRSAEDASRAVNSINLTMIFRRE
jgi:hypothetical protein